jgi:hypothetical protein
LVQLGQQPEEASAPEQAVVEEMSGAELVATVDLRGGACAVNLAAHGRPACPQMRSQAPVLARLVRQRAEQPQRMTLSLLGEGGAVLCSAAEQAIAEDGRGVQTISLDLRPGADGWVEICLVQHASPG